VSANEQATISPTLEAVCFIQLQTNARVSDRSLLDMGEEANRRMDALMHLVRRTATQVTSITAHSAANPKGEHIKRNENQICRRMKVLPGTSWAL